MEHELTTARDQNLLTGVGYPMSNGVTSDRDLAHGDNLSYHTKATFRIESERSVSVNTRGLTTLFMVFESSA